MKSQREKLVGEAEHQHTVVTAARKEETIDSKDQELQALIEKTKTMDRKDKAQVRDISKKIKQGTRDKKDPKYMRKFIIFLKNSKE